MRCLILMPLVLGCTIFASSVQAQSIKGDAGGSLEYWTKDNNHLRHRILLDMGLNAKLGPVKARVYYGFRYWVTADTFMLNAESGHVLEKVHGGTLTFDTGPCDIGGWVGRRAILKQHVKSEWSRSLAYYDGTAPYIACERGNADMQFRGPHIKWHVVTLVYPKYTGSLGYKFMSGKMRATADYAFGFTLDPEAAVDPKMYKPHGLAYDLGLMYDTGHNVMFGLKHGHIAYPGYESPVKRTALVIRLGTN